jgi:hypothetical protein
MATLPNVYGRRQAPQDRGGVVPTYGGSEQGRAIQGLAGTLDKAAQAYQRDQDTQAVFAARRKLDEWERAAMFDPAKGAVSKRGADAFGLPQQLTEDFDKVAGEVAGTLSTNQQRRAFQELATSRRGQVASWADRHATKERETYEEGQYQADVASMTDRAAQMPDRAPAEIAMMELRTIGHLRSRGRSEEEINLALAQQRNKAHASVVASMLSADNDAGAATYFEANKASMSADTVARVQEAIQGATVLKAAQDNADELIEAGVPMAQAMEMTRGKFEGKAREAALTQVKARYAEKELEKKQAELSSYETARLHVEQGQRIPYNVWAGMDDGHRADILAAQRGRAEAMEKKAQGKDVKTDWPTYTRLRDFAGTNPEEFIADDLGKYAGLIAGPQLEQLQDLKDRLSQPKSAKDTIGLQRQVTAAVNELKLTGTRGAEKRGALQSAIYDAIDAAQETKGKPLTYKERQAEIDKLLVAGEVESGSWWKSDLDARLYEVAGDPEQRAKFVPTISDADRATIVQRFEARGIKKPTPDQIMQAYKAWKKL